MQYYNGLIHSLKTTIFHTPYSKKIFSLSNMGSLTHKVCDTVHIHTKGCKNLPVNLLKKDNINTLRITHMYHMNKHYNICS